MLAAVGIIALVAATLIVGHASQSSSEAGSSKQIYWTVTGKIQRGNADGTGSIEDLVTGLSNPLDIAVDEDSGKIYWADFGTGLIQRANIDGTGVETVVSGVQSPIGVGVSGPAGLVFYAETGTGKIRRAPVTGGSGVDVVTGVDFGFSGGLAPNAPGGKVYWTANDEIQRANLDGTLHETVVNVGPGDVAVDLSGGKVYWETGRADLDGTNIETTSFNCGPGMTVDVPNGRRYCADLGAGQIKRANLDGTSDEVVWSGLDSPLSVAISSGPGEVPTDTPTLADTPLPVGGISLNGSRLDPGLGSQPSSGTSLAFFIVPAVLAVLLLLSSVGLASVRGRQ